jgi:hypothetical protein
VVTLIVIQLSIFCRCVVCQARFSLELRERLIKIERGVSRAFIRP